MECQGPDDGGSGGGDAFAMWFRSIYIQLGSFIGSGGVVCGDWAFGYYSLLPQKSISQKLQAPEMA